MKWYLKTYDVENKSGPALRSHLLNCAKDLNMEEHDIYNIFGNGILLGKLGISLDSDNIQLWVIDDPDFLEKVDSIVAKYAATFL